MEIAGLGAAALLALTVTGSARPGVGQPAATPDAERQAYVRAIEAERRAADEELQSDQWSPLAMIAMRRLGTEPLSVGSGDDDELSLEGRDVVPRHARIVPQPNGDEVSYRILAGAGAVYTDSTEAAPVVEAELRQGGPRFRVGRFIVYFDDLPTLGPVVRVLDFSAPAYLGFHGLSYFPVDPSYRVEAGLRPYPEPRAIRIVETAGFVSTAWVWGEANFELDGHPATLELIVFTPRPVPGGSFYVIFGDTTNGEETSPNCRYLLPDFTTAETIVLDFNRAVNPHCAYSEAFSCPLPPPGNRLDFPIRAGVKDYRPLDRD